LALAGAGGAAALAQRVDWASAKLCLGELGVRAPLAVVPYFIVLLVDSMGWRSTFESRPPLWTLWRIRAATEAVVVSLPAGVAFGESLRVAMVHRELGLPVSAASANAIVNKVAIAMAQGLFVFGTAALSLWSFDLPALSAAVGLHPFSLTVAFAGWLLLAGALLWLARAKPLARLVQWLTPLGGQALRGRSERIVEIATQVDGGLAMFARLSYSQRTRALSLFLPGWVALGAENWVVLSLLGQAKVGLSAAMAIEALVSLVRIGFFFVPGALGAQEVSYYGLLRACGVANPGAVAAAFMIVKRSREIFWIAVGYIILAFGPSRARRAGTALASGATSETIDSSNAGASVDPSAPGPR